MMTYSTCSDASMMEQGEKQFDTVQSMTCQYLATYNSKVGDL